MLIAKHTVILFKNKPHIILEGTNATKNFPLAPSGTSETSISLWGRNSETSENNPLTRGNLLLCST